MNPTRKWSVLVSQVFIFCCLWMFSCNENSVIDYTSNDNASVQSESNSDSQTEETDDIAALALSADPSTLNGREDTGGRTDITIADDRFNCAVISLEKATANTPPVNSVIYPHGFITVDFGSNCTGPGGRTRSGKIIFEYAGRRFLPNSKVVTTFDRYSVNGIKLEGTRTLSNVSANENTAVAFSIVETGMKVTYPDGSFVTRTSNRIRTWNRTLSPTGDTWSVTGSAAGVTRRGKTYTMTIVKELIFKRSCAINNRVFIPVSGIKELRVDGKVITIDFGNGDCDNRVTITILGKSKVIDLTADGN